jgi:hypothetical protein
MDGVTNNTATTNAESRVTENRQAERATPGPTNEQRGQITQSVDATTNRDATRVADQVTGGDTDRLEAAGKGKAAPKDKSPGLKDGDFLHDPRQLTPNQAKDLEKLQKDPKIHPDTRKDIEQFLDDYKNKRDRLFPDNPNPYPNPYPRIRPDQVG